MEEIKTKAARLPNKIEALIPIVVLLAIMISNYVLGWGQDPHIPVLIACAVAMIVGKICGHSYTDMLTGALNAVSQSLEAIIIILCVGCLIGSFEWAVMTRIMPAITVATAKPVRPNCAMML